MTHVIKNYLLGNTNTFGVDAAAALFASPESIEELIAILKGYDDSQLPLLIMGEGSNILFKGDYEGLIINPGMKGIEELDGNDKQIVVRVGASENWDNWVATATEKGWFGLENLSLIPGSVGSAPVQNIGAYGVELKDHFAWADAWDLQLKKQVRLTFEDCKFGYRSSIFKHEARGRYIITHVVFRLKKTPEMKLNYGNVGSVFAAAGGSSPMDLREIIISIRKQKLPDPEQYGNAGSYFKNPMVDHTIYESLRRDYPEIPSFMGIENQIKIPAAWLIEQAGWKGKRTGNVGTWPTQPLVIVNYGGASGQEILDFSENLRTDVDKKFGIYLEREVNVV